MRADLLVANKLNISRNKAQELLKNEMVLINDLLKKPNDNVKEDDKVSLLQDFYVSRAAYKLKGFLEFFPIDIKDKSCLDVGSSTGGFTQILLLNGAKSVSCVDVGTKQLHESLIKDERIMLFENTDIKNYTQKAQIVVCDVSFISVKKILEHLKDLFLEYLIILFKPQFELDKSIKRSKNGVIKNEKDIQKALCDFEKFYSQLALINIAKQKSLLSGKEGNYEYFFAFKK